VDVSSPTSVRNDGKIIAGFKESLDKSILALPARNRYTEKDSLYLDVGKPEMNGKLDSISNGSVNGSLFMKGGDTPTSNNNNSVSSFAKKAEGASPERLKGQSRSFKAHTPTVNQQSFLKAAIFNNIAKNTDMGGNDGSRHDTSPTKIHSLNRHQRHNSDLVLRTGTPYSASSSGSDELDDVGDENCQIDRDFESIKVKTPKKHPSKAFQCSQTVRMSSLTHKKKDY